MSSLNLDPSLQVVDQGTICRGQAGTDRAIYTYPNLTWLSNGVLVAMLRSGSGKDTSDESLHWFQSSDCGSTWVEKAFSAPRFVNGVLGSARSGHITEVEPGRLMAAVLWVDRSTYPGRPLFNPDTEGCLPMKVLLADSDDFGNHWSTWRVVATPDELGPPSLTAPILKLDHGELAMSIETNKTYLDKSKWNQRVVLFVSNDQGQSWSDMRVAGCDTTGRIFNWDQRVGMSPDGRLATFNWTYDSQSNAYRNIHRRVSSDGGCTWTPPNDLGFADQAGRPAILPDGQIVLPYVDRFNSQSIRARWAPDIESPFDPASDVMIYENRSASKIGPETSDTASALCDMSIWNYGLPAAEVLPCNNCSSPEVIVGYYAGTSQTMDARWARLRVPIST